MQENVRNYTSLEVEAKTIESKIYYLERIHELYESYNSDKNKCDQAQYLVAKLEIAKKKQEIVNINFINKDSDKKHTTVKIPSKSHLNVSIIANTEVLTIELIY
jgi:deoxyadenosine/deoxycytidine kinase